MKKRLRKKEFVSIFFTKKFLMIFLLKANVFPQFLLTKTTPVSFFYLSQKQFVVLKDSLNKKRSFLRALQNVCIDLFVKIKRFSVGRFESYF